MVDIKGVIDGGDNELEQFMENFFFVMLDELEGSLGYFIID